MKLSTLKGLLTLILLMAVSVFYGKPVTEDSNKHKTEVTLKSTGEAVSILFVVADVYVATETRICRPETEFVLVKVKQPTINTLVDLDTGKTKIRLHRSPRDSLNC